MKKLLVTIMVYAVMIEAVAIYHSFGISVLEAVSAIAFVASGALLAEKLF